MTWTDRLLRDQTSFDARMRQFHAHLDGCAQCSAHPFDLCPIGQVLLMSTALKEVPRFAGLNTETP